MMKAVRIAVLLLVAGCNQFYGLDETRLFVPIDGPGCSDGVFEGPTLDPFPDFDMAQPDARFDLEELWMEGSGMSPRGLYYSTRTSTTAAWSMPVRASFTIDEDRSPALSGDGLRLMFISSGRPGARIYELVRPSLDVPFGGMPQPVAGIGDRGSEVDLSYDGKTIYYYDVDAVFQATRPSFDEPFEQRMMVSANTEYPTVSPDGLELFYNDNSVTRLLRQTRSSTTVPFSSPELLRDTAEDPDMVANGTMLYVHVRNRPGVLRRDCPQKRDR